jgi:hypothetical protein
VFDFSQFLPMPAKKGKKKSSSALPPPGVASSPEEMNQWLAAQIQAVEKSKRSSCW